LSQILVKNFANYSAFSFTPSLRSGLKSFDTYGVTRLILNMPNYKETIYESHDQGDGLPTDLRISKSYNI